MGDVDVKVWRYGEGWAGVGVGMSDFSDLRGFDNGRDEDGWGWSC